MAKVKQDWNAINVQACLALLKTGDKHLAEFKSIIADNEAMIARIQALKPHIGEGLQARLHLMAKAVGSGKLNDADKKTCVDYLKAWGTNEKGDLPDDRELKVSMKPDRWTGKLGKVVGAMVAPGQGEEGDTVTL